MARNLNLFAIWIEATRRAEFALRYHRTNSAMPAVVDLAADHVACQAIAIGFASR